MTITIKIKNKEKLVSTKKFLEENDLEYKEKKKKIYNPEFVEKILQGEKDLIAGKGVKMTVAELNKLWE